ncbi:hypothetical protein PKB_1255 [Pseudomonas knackmussii B13]|uniref:Uncharacterized protein n=1 Tax=Pseudomonas knackmussii (strain DSM 6978 / CCUG 54928 / LMG 23759 / B13) TaxID=1301098 RepID=A0A024HC50_PSEKB|nr:hypothetical protein [Pseudomonas knackmussii]CDF82620.1 hypothetical protein PKB_1255 [Pseudomonas knackmussii B13]
MSINTQELATALNIVDGWLMSAECTIRITECRKCVTGARSALAKAIKGLQLRLPKSEAGGPLYSEGICDDGAAILRNGMPVPVTEIIDLLNRCAHPPANIEGDSHA